MTLNSTSYKSLKLGLHVKYLKKTATDRMMGSSWSHVWFMFARLQTYCLWPHSVTGLQRQSYK